MEKWQISEIAYYIVNDKQFNSKKEAEDYSLKLFLVTELKKIMDKIRKSNSNFKDTIRILSDNKTICYEIYKVPLIDTWNTGHYGCTGMLVDRSIYKKFTSIGDIMNFAEGRFIMGELFEVTDSIDLEKLSTVCDQETLDKITLYKEMINKLKSII